MNLSSDILSDIAHRFVVGQENRESVFNSVIEHFHRQLGITNKENSNDPYDLDPETDATLRQAIEGAFAAKAREIASWPSPTDYDRLRAAFDTLDENGIVALECAGFTQDDSVPRAAEIAVVRDELGKTKTQGYCFFTWNNMWNVIYDRASLSLAYGGFTETLTDEQAVALTTKVGASVLEACRDAGLVVDWTGSPEDFVTLPHFKWQRRLVDAQESDVRDFLEGWELEIRAGYSPVSDKLEVLELLEERAAVWFERFANFGPSLRRRLSEHTERVLEDEQRREAKWVEATVNDRITSAFEELDRRGVLARECLGLTIQDGWGYAGMEAEPHHRGVVFFHHEDVIDAVGGHDLFLAFGALGCEQSRDDEATLALGREVLETLARTGIAASWEQSARQRIRIAPFEWRRRRWTTAPSYERIQGRREEFGRSAGPSHKFSEVGPTTNGQLGIVVRAERDENGFDMRRARQLREAWKTAGKNGEAHVGHVGLPHVFVRAGEFTSMAPILAAANLRDEKREIFLRGVRAKKASI